MLLGWQVGVLCSLLGSLLGTLGGQLRISSLAKQGSMAWILQCSGWACWLTGQGLGQVAILLAPAVVAACVTFSGSLLCNALLAPFVLHERLARSHCWGILLLSLGGTAVTTASCHGQEEFDWPTLRSLGLRPETAEGFYLLVAVTIAVLINAKRRGRLDIVSFALLFALCGSLDLLVTKFTLQLIRLRVEAEPGHAPPSEVVGALTGLMLTLHVCTFFCQAVSAYYRRALQSLPLFLGSGAIMQILLCGLFFKTFLGFDRVQAITFLTGMVLVLAGMVVTSQAGQRPAKPAGEPVKDATPEDDLKRSDTPELVSPHAKDQNLSSMPIISSGLMDRSMSSLSGSDLFLIGEIQRSAMVFGGQCDLAQSPRSGASVQKFASAPILQWAGVRTPLLRSVSADPGRMHGNHPSLNRAGNLSAGLNGITEEGLVSVPRQTTL